MYGLIISLSEDEQIAIGNELDRLFIFQDRPFSKEKKALFLQEMTRWGIPSGAIVSGLRKLMTEDLKSLKLAAIKDAAYDFVHIEDDKKTKCDFCFGMGCILMRRDDNYEFAFACQCANGNSYRNNRGLVTWNGDTIQAVNGKNFRVPKRFAVKK